MATQSFEHSTLVFVAQCSYRLIYRAVHTWLLSSDYYYQITIIMDLVEILIRSGSPDNSYQDPTGCPWSLPSRRYTLPPILRNLANKQTNKQTNRPTKEFIHTEYRTLDPRVFSTMFLPTKLQGRTHLITNIRLLLSHYQKILATQSLEHSTLVFVAQCSYRLIYRAVLIWLLLSDYYYQITIILDLIEILIKKSDQ